MPDFLNILQSVGFPIAACVFLGYFIKTQNAQYREDVQNITDKYESAIKDFKESLDKNTQVLTRLDARLDKSTELVD